MHLLLKRINIDADVEEVLLVAADKHVFINSIYMVLYLCVPLPKQVKKHMHLLLKRINIDADVEEVLLVAPGSILPYMRTGVERSFEVNTCIITALVVLYTHMYLYICIYVYTDR